MYCGAEVAWDASRLVKLAKDYSTIGSEDACVRTAVLVPAVLSRFG